MVILFLTQNTEAQQKYFGKNMQRGQAFLLAGVYRVSVQDKAVRVFCLEAPVKVTMNSKINASRKELRLGALAGIRDEFLDHYIFVAEDELPLLVEGVLVGFNPKIEYSFSDQEVVGPRNHFYLLKLHSGQECNMRLIQMHEQYVQGTGYEYSDVFVNVLQLSPARMVSEGKDVSYTKQEYSLLNQDLQKLDAGEYLIRVRVNWISPERLSRATLLVASKHTHDLTALQHEEGDHMFLQTMTRIVKEDTSTPMRDDSGHSYKNLQSKGVYAFYIRNNRKTNSEITAVYENCKNLRLYDQDNERSPTVDIVIELTLGPGCEHVNVLERENERLEANFSKFKIYHK
jgi:hypothetical protein